MAPSTRQRRGKSGTWPGKKLHVSGQLESSFVPFASPAEAGVGTQDAKAKYHHFGTRRMPERRALPVNDKGHIQPALKAQLLAVLKAHLLVGVKK